MNSHTPEKLNSNDKSISLLVLAGVLTIILWQIPFGGYILYPFTLLSTWFHEMGHGLTALLLGGEFEYLEIFASAGGLAHNRSSHNMLVGYELWKVLTALGGLIGPPIAGATFIIFGRKKLTARIALAAFAVFLIASAFIWIRTVVGIAIIVAFGLIAGLIALKGSARVQQFSIQFFGMQAALATFRRMDYLFMGNAVVNGKEYTSDVGAIANVLILPYWFWGALISAFSIFLVYFSLKIALKAK